MSEYWTATSASDATAIAEEKLIQEQDRQVRLYRWVEEWLTEVVSRARKSKESADVIIDEALQGFMNMEVV